MWVCNLRGDFKVPGHWFQAKSWAMWALQKGRSCCSYMGGCCMRVTEQYKLMLFKCWKGVRLVVPQPFKCCLASESGKPFMLWLVERYRARKCFKCWLLHSAGCFTVQQKPHALGRESQWTGVTWAFQMPYRLTLVGPSSFERGEKKMKKGRSLRREPCNFHIKQIINEL